MFVRLKASQTHERAATAWAKIRGSTFVREGRVRGIVTVPGPAVNAGTRIMTAVGVHPLIRRLATLTVVALVGLSAVACSPASRNNVALFLRDGTPTALIHPCPREAVTELAVTDLTTPSTPRPGGPTTDLYVPYWDVRAGDSDARPTEIPLLTVPAGWSLDPEIVIPLRELRPGYRYRLGTTQVGSRDVEFTLADLDGLGADQVWAVADQGEETAMTRDEFFRIAESHCK